MIKAKGLYDNPRAVYSGTGYSLREVQGQEKIWAEGSELNTGQKEWI